MKWGLAKKNYNDYDMLTDSFDRFVDSFFSTPQARGEIGPAVDIEENDKSYTVTTELPGMDEKNIDVTLVDGLLTITGEKKEESKKEDSKCIVSERRYGSFKRSFRLPENVKADEIKAQFKNGILTIDVPKAQTPKPKQIKIQIAG